MAKNRISDCVREQIRQQLNEGRSTREVAVECGVSISFVKTISYGRPSRKKESHHARDISFRSCKKYFCKNCRCEVSIHPCPACVARAASVTTQSG
jgi:hypothetical protein